MTVKNSKSPGSNNVEVWQQVPGPAGEQVPTPGLASSNRSPRAPGGPRPAGSKMSPRTRDLRTEGGALASAQGGGETEALSRSDSVHSTATWDGHGVFPAWLTSRADFRGAFARYGDGDGASGGLHVPLSSLNRAPEKRTEEDRAAIAHWLLHGPLAELSEDGVDNLARCAAVSKVASVREAEIDETLTSEGVDGGVEGDGLFYVVSGRLHELRGGEVVRDLPEGACTGAAALPRAGPARATLVAVERTLLVSLRARDYRDAAAFFAEQQAHRSLAFLAQRSALSVWSRNKLRALARRARFRECAPGSRPLEQGRPTREVSFVLRGRVELLRSYEQQAVNRWPRSLREWETRTHRLVRPLVVDEVVPGGHFGEECLLGNDPAPAAFTAVAPGGCQLLCFPRDAALALLDARILRVFRRTAAARADSLDDLRAAAEANVHARRTGTALRKLSFGPQYVSRKLAGAPTTAEDERRVAFESALKQATKHLSDADKRDRVQRKQFLATSVRYRDRARAPLTQGEAR